jgi:hypothetical protein
LDLPNGSIPKEEKQLLQNHNARIEEHRRVGINVGEMPILKIEQPLGSSNPHIIEKKTI